MQHKQVDLEWCCIIKTTQILFSTLLPHLLQTLCNTKLRSNLSRDEPTFWYNSISLPISITMSSNNKAEKTFDQGAMGGMANTDFGSDIFDNPQAVRATQTPR